MNIYQVKISLDNAKPSIYRTVLVKPNSSFYELHHIIQFAMGWEGFHSYQFETNDFYIADPEEFGETESIDPFDILVNEVLKKSGDKIKYEYDFGDSWMFTIKLEKIIPQQVNTIYPICIRGKRNSPPEDSGGIWGYEHLKKVIANEEHPEHDEIMEWLDYEFDPDYFDMNETNSLLKNLEEYLFDAFDDDYAIENDLNNIEESDKEFQNHLFNIVNEQMDENNPPEAAATFKRLLNTDFSHLEAKQMIARCVSYEFMSIVTEGKSFNMNRYIKHLKKLPFIDFE